MTNRRVIVGIHIGLMLLAWSTESMSFSPFDRQKVQADMTLHSASPVREFGEPNIGAAAGLETPGLPRDADGDGYFDIYETLNGSDPLDIHITPDPTVYVDPSAGTSGNGTIAAPFKTIQEALDAALDFDLIELADGVYRGAGNKNLSFRGKRLFVTSVGGPDRCMIDCEGSGRGVLFVEDESPLSVLRGITIVNGNVASGDGGAIHCQSTSPIILDCVLANNAAWRGGGIYLEDSSPAIQDSVVVDNVAHASGGGIFADEDSNPLVEGTAFQRNVPDNQGRQLPADVPELASAGRIQPSHQGLTGKRYTPPSIVSSSVDTDADGLPDDWEIEHGLDPDDASDRMADPDADGFGNIYEFVHQTEPQDSASAPSPTLFVRALSVGSIQPLTSPLASSGSTVPPLSNAGPSKQSLSASLIAPLQPSPLPAPTPVFFPSIQAALDGAKDYDIVEVGDGKYSGPGNRELEFLGKPIMLVSAGGPDRCIVDCQGMGRGVRFGAGEDDRTVLRGFTVLNGRAIGGGGIACENSSPTIQDCVLIDNRAVHAGGGIYLLAASPVLENIILSHNSASIGGGLFNGPNADPIIRNCTVVNNEASLSGGGIGHHLSFVGALIENTILWGNSPEELDGSNRYRMSYSLVQGGWPGLGNLDADPQLTARHRLTVTSPCIDTGRASIDAPARDMDGELRGNVRGTFLWGYDIGADEFVDTDRDGLPDHWEIAQLGSLLSAATADDDADGLNNAAEYFQGTDPRAADSDGDGLPDGEELALHGTSPVRLDTDGDGLPDGWELDHGLAPAKGSDGMEDADSDGFPNAYEFTHGTNPRDVGSVPQPTHRVNASPLLFTGSLPRPYSTIQDALDAAGDFDIIEIADGRYTGTGNKELDFRGKPLLVYSQNGPEHVVIDCEGSGRGVRFQSGEDSGSVLRGVTIRNGWADRGAGIFFSEASPLIQNCILTENTAILNGGGLCADASSPRLENLIVAHNEAPAGAGLFVAESAEPLLRNCTVVQNDATGGLGSGGGVGHQGGSSLSEIQNSIVWGNTPEQVDSQGQPEIRFSLVQYGWPGVGNFDANPQLTVLQRLTSASPCINRGDASSVTATDIDGETRGKLRRTFFFNVDVGADEFVDLDSDGLPDTWEKMHFGDLTQEGTQDQDGIGGPDGLSNLDEYLQGTDPRRADTDRDGLSDGEELQVIGTSPIHADDDQDGLTDGDEVQYGTDPNRADSDGDGLTDGDEVGRGTSPNLADTDHDGIDDGNEVAQGSNPLLWFDLDGDQIPDDWERFYALNPRNWADAGDDPDGDGLSNLEEYRARTDPRDYDTDGDLLSDTFERDGGLDPAAYDNPQGDRDGDGLSNLDEAIYGTNPTEADTDGDGVTDGKEVDQGSNPNDGTDGGTPPPPDELVEIELTVGDPSSSHSERYNLIVGPITHQAPKFGEVETRTYRFRRGETYEVSLRHTGTKPSFIQQNGHANYDWTAATRPLDPTECVYVEDPDNILTTYIDWPNSTFLADGKKAYLHICSTDLDIDSDNNDGFDPPSRSRQEDDVEEVYGDTNRPGKSIGVNDGDWDDDGTPDFADGFNRFADNPSDDKIGSDQAGEALSFVPLIVELSEPIDLSTCRIRFDYSASDPNLVTRLGAGTVSDPYRYETANGHLRIWTKDATSARNPAPAGSSGQGDFVAPEQVVTASDLGSGRTLTLYVEGIRDSAAAADQTIHVEIDPNGPAAQPGFVGRDAVNVTLFSVYFVDSGGERVDFSTSFSHPNPTVEIGIGQNLADITLADLTVNHATTTATVRIEGKVSCPLADIVEGRAADITEVLIRAGTPTLDNPDPVSRVPVTNVSTVDLSECRPYRSPSDPIPHPYEGRFETDVVIPLVSGDNLVTVGAVNAIGNDGYDSFSLRVEPTSTGLAVTAVKNKGGTEPGTFNPIWVYIDDPAVDTQNGDRMTAQFFGNRFPLTIQDGQLRIDRPFVKLGRELKSGVTASNILNVETHPEASVAEYKGLHRVLGWSFTAHSPPNVYKYAAGTKVRVNWYDPSLDNGWSLESRSVYEKTGWTWTWGGKEDQDFGTLSKTWTSVTNENENVGVQFEVDIASAALNHPTKSFQFGLVKGKERKLLKWAAEFKVVPLKTIIVAVDGFAYAAATNAIASINTPTFSKVFGGSAQHKKPVLSAFPTVTFCNWPGIFSGDPPSAHGWIGNAWFPRETATGNQRLPFASANDIDGVDRFQNAGIGAGGHILSHMFSMDERALPEAGSLYDMVAAVAANPNNQLQCTSINMFYDRSRSTSTDLASTHYGFKERHLTDHDVSDSTALDRLTTLRGAIFWPVYREKLDLLTLYFPGPDSVAHGVGAAENPPPGYTAGQIGDVTNPLPSILAHVERVTDGELGHIVDCIEDDGYLNACLFILVADHGLIAYRNTPEFNIVTALRENEELQQVLEAPVHRLWRGNSFENRTIVYSPNGGMAHVYVRSGFAGRTWQEPPLNSDVEEVARLIYSEAVGGNSQIYAKLAPLIRTNATPEIRTQGALGNPPAIFVRYGGTDELDPVNNNFMRSYRWVKGVGGADARVVLGTVNEFLEARDAAGRPVQWPAFEARLEESNHKNATGSRSGDIILVMDGEQGYLTTNQGDELNGWHGGPTVAESNVPMMFNMPGSALVTPPGKTNPEFVHQGFDDYIKSDLKPDGFLRSYQMAHILTNIVGKVRSPNDPPR